MRMRRKRNADSRLRESDDRIIKILPRSEYDARKAILSPEYIDTLAVFGNNNPVWLEIGCGLGGFACGMARLHPEVNIIAVEKVDNVILGAYDRLKIDDPGNVRLLHTGAEYLRKYIAPHSIERIYLNFSCPYPPKSYANRRLTNPRFLREYLCHLAPGGCIVQKTDNRNFFDYSLDGYVETGYELKAIDYDYHVGSDDVVTEYESKFLAQNKPIYRVIAYPSAKQTNL